MAGEILPVSRREKTTLVPLPSSLGENLECQKNGEEMKNLLSLIKKGVEEHWDTIWRSGQLPAAYGAESHEKHCGRGTEAPDNSSRG